MINIYISHFTEIYDIIPVLIFVMNLQIYYFRSGKVLFFSVLVTCGGLRFNFFLSPVSMLNYLSEKLS